MKKETGVTGAEVLPAGPEDLEKINRYTLRRFGAEELFVFRVALCNNDLDRDGEYFPLKTLRELERLFPGKTGLFDHSMQSKDQHARIFDTCVEAVPGRLTRLGEPFYLLRAKAYLPKTPENAALVREIEAGIKKEVSVGCAVARKACSICGEKAGGCGHTPGSRYRGKRCGRQLLDALDAYEWSFVAVPAQPEAGVTKQFTKEKGETVLLEEMKQGQPEVLTKEEARALRKELESLRRDAEAGRAYRERLQREVSVLCAVELPQMDMAVFDRLTKNMSVQELCSFRKAFGGDSTPGACQLGGMARPESQDNTVFKI